MVHKTHADKKCSLDFLSRSVEENVRAYHRSFPVYKETPLACLKETAKALGVSSIYVKDESYRFGLNAFKVLGGSYAMGHYLADKLGIDMKEVTYEKLTSEETRKRSGYYLCHGNRWQSWPRRCLDGKPAPSAFRGLHAGRFS